MRFSSPRVALGGVAVLGLLAGGYLASQAQVAVVPQVGVATGYVPKVTYSAGFFGLVPVTTANTDQVCIAGSATKTIRVQEIKVSGTTATAVQNVPFLLLRRILADTGGTLGTTTANPNNNIAKRDVNSAAATATLASYTAAPTVNDTSPTYIDSQMLPLPIITSVMPAPVISFNFVKDIAALLNPPALVGVNAQLCIQNSVALTNASLLNGSITWTEE